jgi:UDP-N-acetylglucosamine--N-acetylmuramyl-(pentapeptide) pyrophosphoryl-undecaprenol N-acetylglucosamine transferase
VLHIAGDKSELVDLGQVGYHLMKYCDRMELAIAVADLAIARSGSGTVSEFAAVGLPAVFVPYPVGNGEQRFNAMDAVGAGGAILLADAELTPDWIRQSLVPLLGDPAAIATMAAGIASVGTRDGAERMVQLVASTRH